MILGLFLCFGITTFTQNKPVKKEKTSCCSSDKKSSCDSTTKIADNDPEIITLEEFYEKYKDVTGFLEVRLADNTSNTNDVIEEVTLEETSEDSDIISVKEDEMTGEKIITIQTKKEYNVYYNSPKNTSIQKIEKPANKK